jgi:hypothetical protein
LDVKALDPSTDAAEEAAMVVGSSAAPPPCRERSSAELPEMGEEITELLLLELAVEPERLPAPLFSRALEMTETSSAGTKKGPAGVPVLPQPSSAASPASCVQGSPDTEAEEEAGAEKEPRLTGALLLSMPTAASEAASEAAAAPLPGPATVRAKGASALARRGWRGGVGGGALWRMNPGDASTAPASAERKESRDDAKAWCCGGWGVGPPAGRRAALRGDSEATGVRGTLPRLSQCPPCAGCGAFPLLPLLPPLPPLPPAFAAATSSTGA